MFSWYYPWYWRILYVLWALKCWNPWYITIPLEVPGDHPHNHWSKASRAKKLSCRNFWCNGLRPARNVRIWISRWGQKQNGKKTWGYIYNKNMMRTRRIIIQLDFESQASIQEHCTSNYQVVSDITWNMRQGIPFNWNEIQCVSPIKEKQTLECPQRICSWTIPSLLEF